MTYLITEVCDIISVVNASVYGKVWYFIAYSSSQAWFYLIILSLIIWFILELMLDGSSANGFSPIFNKFAGSGGYFLISSAFFYIPALLSFGITSCFYIPIVHVITFPLVKLFYKRINFWTY